MRSSLACLLGIQLLDPSGNSQFVFPRLFSFVGDEPEIKDLSCVKGVPSREPCEACRCPVHSLSDITKVWPLRTEKEQKERLRKALEKSVGLREADCSKYSFQPVPSGLWGFAEGENEDLGGSSQCFAFEAMHNEDLGVFLYIIDNCKVGAWPKLSCALFT
jgi:hypothetical protein